MRLNRSVRSVFTVRDLSRSHRSPPSFCSDAEVTMQGFPTQVLTTGADHPTKHRTVTSAKTQRMVLRKSGDRVVSFQEKRSG